MKMNRRLELTLHKELVFQSLFFLFLQGGTGLLLRSDVCENVRSLTLIYEMMNSCTRP